MSKNLNLCEILKGCPKGEVFYSPTYGEVEFIEVYYGAIRVRRNYPATSVEYFLSKDGKRFDEDWGGTKGKCDLFPSERKKSWKNYVAPPEGLQPNDPVYYRESEYDVWKIGEYGGDGTVKIETENVPFDYIISCKDVGCVDALAKMKMPYGVENYGKCQDYPHYDNTL